MTALERAGSLSGAPAFEPAWWRGTPRARAAALALLALIALLALPACAAPDSTDPVSSLNALMRWRDSIADIDATYSVTGVLPSGEQLTPLTVRLRSAGRTLTLTAQRNGAVVCEATATMAAYEVTYPGAEAKPVTGPLPPGTSAWLGAAASDIGILRRLFARGGLRQDVSVDVTLSPTASENEVHVMDGPRIVERVTLIPGVAVPAEWRFFYGGKETVVSFAGYRPSPEVVFPTNLTFRQRGSSMDLTWTAESVTVTAPGDGA